jgi:hypothetical protein
VALIVCLVSNFSLKELCKEVSKILNLAMPPNTGALQVVIATRYLYFQKELMDVYSHSPNESEYPPDGERRPCYKELSTYVARG